MLIVILVYIIKNKHKIKLKSPKIINYKKNNKILIYFFKEESVKKNKFKISKNKIIKTNLFDGLILILISSKKPTKNIKFEIRK